MSNSSTYLRFLHLAQAISTELPNAEVDSTAIRLLEAIAVSELNKAPLTVTDAMALNSIASPATLHRKINNLIELDLIAQVFDGGNRRTKYLVTTKHAAGYFNKLGQAMSQALKA
jgi:DNA-binding MarR family transcriptional regulator